ncbi:hypothetical protein Tco_0871214 [Tanacetum coccineum]
MVFYKINKVLKDRIGLILGEGRITGKGTIRTPTLDFENVYYVKELQQFNLFSISQICVKKNRVLFTDTDCKQTQALIRALTDCGSIFWPLANLLHMDSLWSIHQFEALTTIYYCLVITDDYSQKKQLEQEGFIVMQNPQQNRVCLRGKNRTSLESAELCGLTLSYLYVFGMHSSKKSACYVLNRVLADEGYIVGYSASNRAYRVYNVPNKRVEETMNLRYLEEKPNVQGLGHEWYFDLDYLTGTLGYNRDKANQSAGTQEASTNPVEAEPKDTSGDEVDDSPLDSAEEIFQQELARLKGQEQRATSDAKDVEELQKRASTKTVPPGSIPVPTGSIPVPTGSPTDSFFNDEPTTRFLGPSNLGNNEPSPDIFSSLSYDDEFGADLNNLASTVEVNPVATKRINTIHP